MKKKITRSVISFLLLVPFRLTISVLLIKLFNWSAGLAGSGLNNEVLASNVVMSKAVYDLALGGWMLYCIIGMYNEMMPKIRSTSVFPINGEMVRTEYWLVACVFSIAAVVTFICFDLYWTNEIFWNLKNN